MDINQIELPSGMNKKQFRETANLLVGLSGWYGFTKERFSNRGQSKGFQWDDALLNFLVDKKLLTIQEKEGETVYQATVNLSQVANSSLKPRKTSEKAWLDVAKTLVRAVAINEHAHEWAAYKINSFYLFGSLLNPDKKNYGDADLVICKEVKDGKNFTHLVDKSNVWANEHWNCISSKAQSSLYGFDTSAQLMLDIRNSNSFISFHSEHDPIELNKEFYQDKCFPIISLFHNSTRPDDIELKAMSDKWVEENSETYTIVVGKLNHALSEIGVVPFDDTSFTTSCCEAIKRQIVDELNHSYGNLENFIETLERERPALLKQIVRLDTLGFEAIGQWLHQQSIICDEPEDYSWLSEQCNPSPAMIEAMQNAWNELEDAMDTSSFDITDKIATIREQFLQPHRDTDIKKGKNKQK